MSSAVSTTSRMRILPPHLRQTVTSTANTRASSLAHTRRRGRGEDSVSSSGLSFAESARPSASCCPGVGTADGGRRNDARPEMRAICEHTEVSGHVITRRRYEGGQRRGGLSSVPRPCGPAALRRSCNWASVRKATTCRSQPASRATMCQGGLPGVCAAGGFFVDATRVRSPKDKPRVAGITTVPAETPLTSFHNKTGWQKAIHAISFHPDAPRGREGRKCGKIRRSLPFFSAGLALSTCTPKGTDGEESGPGTSTESTTMPGNAAGHGR